MKLTILAIAFIFSTFCLASPVQAQTQHYISQLQPRAEQFKQLLETKQCPRCQLSRFDLSNTDLSGANLSNAELNNAKLNNTNLEGANLRGANLASTELNNANLTNANLEEAQIYASKLNSANLTNANLTSVRLNQSDLSNAKLIGAKLYRADLTDANLTQVDLSKANLQLAYLKNANLTKANLYQTNLENAYTIGSNLDGASLSETKLPNSLKSRNPFLPIIYLLILGYLYFQQVFKNTLNSSSLIWQVMLLFGSNLAGWILSSLYSVAFDWFVIFGAAIGALVGLLYGWYARNIKLKKLNLSSRKDRTVPRNANNQQLEIVGLGSGLAAGIIAGIITWIFAVTGILPFAQWGLELSWSVSLLDGITFHTSGPVGSSNLISWGLFIPRSIIYALVWPVMWLISLTQNPCDSGASIVGYGTYYFANLGTIAAIAIALAVDICITITVSKINVREFDFRKLVNNPLATIIIITCFGLVLGWIIDTILLPGYGANLNLFSKSCR